MISANNLRINDFCHLCNTILIKGLLVGQRRYLLTQLVDAQPPVMRTHAGSTGFISPVWDGSQWAETATADEITAWEQEHPAPEVKPAPKSNAELEAENATLRQQVSALADQQSFYEDCIAEMAEIVYA